ncbi:DUF262 domain-containing protein [Chryseobacterium turcicum]|uniref:DUF262 domain-containing protein n=1 Tax=Chryseobacterium turcicum TaxID=2898076 RepID=A0A9Q3V678_9FLAO|nr:DUF262 domain-containing protein [Chryseobacterium turcicum]MCD1119182.1 DUF262 domain-containing protein [Chryseobacterium turcicum]
MNLINTQEYSLKELFSTSNRKIIIPDFQRDYCWGDKSHGENNDKDLVNDFLDTLLEEFDNNKSEIILGKIDAYENPTDHIYLTDGQQRVTTLYLLIGMLHKKFQETYLKNCLISDFEELDDDQEPYLQYAVRETTVFFLRDLVNEFFIKENDLKVYDIKNQAWFFNEYTLDPSTKSMISALEIIESKSADLTSDFCQFVVENIKIQYYNVQDKKHGEERFVIINTTGKSLTVSENIKPILLGNTQNSELAKQWEERETWFWKNKKKDENISDEGVNDFLTWYFKIKKQQDNIDIIKEAKFLLRKNDNEGNLNNINVYFEALKTIISLLEIEKFQNQFTYINGKNNVLNIVDIRNLNLERVHNILLPLLAFIVKFEDIESIYEFLRRLRKNYFDLKRKHRKNNYLDWRYVLKIIEISNSLQEILTFNTIENSIERISNIPVNIWYNDEEKTKEQLSEHKNLINKWEDHPDFMGDLFPLFAISENLNISDLEKFYTAYLKINPKQFTYSTNIKLGNIYRLILYLNDGVFEHRTVDGWGYCMRNNSDKKLFLHTDFKIIWKNFKSLSEQELLEFFNDRLKEFFKTTVLRHGENVVEFEDLIKDTRKIGHYERVLLWAILEFLDNDNEMYFDGSIAQFWEKPNLIKVENTMSENQIQDYSIGNLILGTSYYNNKTGKFDYCQYPLMKMLQDKKSTITQSEIEENTTRITRKLKTLI